MTTQRLTGIAGFRLVTSDLDRLAQFYRDVLGFVSQGPEEPIDAKEMAVLEVRGVGRRRRLGIGEQALAIDQFEVAGRPYPAESSASSPWFQHLALVVTDIDMAFGSLRDIAPISEGGPQQLPPSSGSARAFKFRDSDGHPVELLQFPPDDVPPAWKGRQPAAGQLAVGIDHSAICVASLEASLAFYAGLGLTPGKRTLNKGVEQQRLDDLRDVEVSVQPMQPPRRPPHLELLAYHVPPVGRGAALRANDVAATRIVWHGTDAALLSDPDGHLHQVEA